MKAPIAWLKFRRSSKKKKLAMRIKTSDNKVINVQMEVEAVASRGILSNELFSMIKLIRVNTAKDIARINFQLKIK